MSVIGIGIDIVEIARLATALERTPRLAARLFTEQERDRPIASLAARFAAKEAVAKALGAPGGLKWTDAEVVTAESGQPLLRLTGGVAAAAEARGIRSWHLSLSHDGGLATAMVVAQS